MSIWWLKPLLYLLWKAISTGKIIKTVKFEFNESKIYLRIGIAEFHVGTALIWQNFLNWWQSVIRGYHSYVLFKTSVLCANEEICIYFYILSYFICLYIHCIFAWNNLNLQNVQCILNIFWYGFKIKKCNAAGAMSWLIFGLNLIRRATYFYLYFEQRRISRKGKLTWSEFKKKLI